MSSVREILLAKKTELSAELVPLFATCTKLRKALAEAEGRIAALNGELSEIHFALKAMDEAQAKAGHLTIMQAVLEILKHRPDGMTSQEILAEINKQYFDGTVVRHSLSPQLSRLKDRHKKIELRGNRWFRSSDEPTLFATKS